MIALLKLLSIADHYFFVANFDKDKFWIPYITEMKKLVLITSVNEDATSAMHNNRDCAEEVLE